MTNAAYFSLGLTLLIGTASMGWSQSTPTDAAINEAVRRQANTILLRQKLGEARTAESRKDLDAAAKLYEDAYKLAQSIGDNTVKMETAETVAGLTSVQMQLARAAQSRGDLQEAKKHVMRVLTVNPKDEAALEFNKQNEKLLAEQAGHVPDETTLERAAAARKEQTNVATLVQDGKLLLEMGKLDEAEAKLKQATNLDPENPAAFYYMSILKERRYAESERRRELSSKESIVKIEQDWTPTVKRDMLPVPNPYAQSDQIYTSKGRQAIVSKLNRIHMEQVGPWDGLPLSEVVRVLSEESRKRDPEKKGINIIINPYVEPSTPPAGAPTVDPATGLPIAVAPPSESVDISSATIKINPALTDVRLADVLDAIVKVANTPVKFSIEDYAVVFSYKAHEAQALYTRTFKVDPNTFYQGLESVGTYEVGIGNNTTGGTGGGTGGTGGSSGTGGQGGQGGTGLGVPRVYVSGGGGQTGGQGGGGGQTGGQGGGGISGGGLRYVTQTNNTDQASAAVRTFFSSLGVDLGGPTAAGVGATSGKSVFFNDRTGILLVRATLQDLDTIEAAIQVLNVTPPQVNVKAKFVEISQGDTRALGFDWYVGNFLMNNGAIAASGGTQPSFQGAPSAGNPQGAFPGNVAAGTTIAPATTDGLLSSGLRNSVSVGANTFNNPAVASVTGILTDPQFRVVIHALEQREGADLLNAPDVTTPSGRQAQIQIVDITTIVTGVNQNQTSSGGGTSTGTTTGTTTGGTGVGTTINYPTAPLPFGTTLDVIPYVSADGFTVQMTIIPTITEFVGYDNPGQFVPQAQSVGGNTLGVPLTAQLPLPRIRLRQVTTSAIVWDGQTVVLGGLISESVLRFKDKVPVLGDLPLVGKLFQSEANSTQKKNLVVFVTPTIIDPAGNRMHSEDEMPFAQNSIPPQRPIVPTP